MKRKWNNTIEIIALGLTAVTVSMAIFSLLTVDDADVKISAMNMTTNLIGYKTINII